MLKDFTAYITHPVIALTQDNALKKALLLFIGMALLAIPLFMISVQITLNASKYFFRAQTPKYLLYKLNLLSASHGGTYA